MDNFNIHKYLRKEYLMEGINDRVSRIKLADLDFDAVNYIFGGNLGYGMDKDSVSFPKDRKSVVYTISLFTDIVVLSELVTACLFAVIPMCLSPSLLNATTLGVVLAPSELGMTTA